MTGELYSYSKKVAHPLKVSSPMATQHTAQSAKIVGVADRSSVSQYGWSHCTSL